MDLVRNLPISSVFHQIANQGVIGISILRRFEKLSLKYALHKLHLRYFDKCLELDVIPDYLKFKPPRLDAYNNSRAYYTKAVNEQRKIVGAKVKELKLQYEEITAKLKSQLSVLDFQLLIYSINTQIVEKAKRGKLMKHNAKLYRLWKGQRPPVPNCIVNLSLHKLSLCEEKAVMFGLNDHILPNKVNPITIRANIDNKIRRICKANNIELTFDSKTILRETTDRFVHEAEKVCNTRRNQALHKTLYQFSKKDTIKICKMDKGIGTVILDTSDYYRKLDSIVDDEHRFKRLDYNINTTDTRECESAPWILKENSVARYCREFIKPLVDKNTYFKLYPTGSQPGKLYGMAKNHKDGCPTIPVLSALNTPEYHLAKWLEKQIKPFLQNKYSVDSSYVFLQELNHLQPGPTDICVSFDVKSLFTNVPLLEVLSDIKKTIFPTKATPTVFSKSKKLTGTVFMNLLKICSESVFLYNGNVYKQTDGVAMGSPLAPLLAEWFIANIENKLLESDIIFKPLFYRRYVDDIFAVFKSVDDRDAFFNLLNDSHRNLTFTMETTTGFLPFLDIEILINDGKFETRVYRKPTNTKVLMNFNSNAPIKWKKSLVNYMLLRALRLSSSAEFFESEVAEIRDILFKNSYPSYMINELICKFISHNKFDLDNFKRGVVKPIINMDNSDLKTIYFKIPYYGRPSRNLQRRIQEQLSKYGIDIRAAFSTTKVSSYFCLKSQCSIFFKAGVVYKFTCSRDEGISYIGETRRQLFTRISEH